MASNEYLEIIDISDSDSNNGELDTVPTQTSFASSKAGPSQAISDPHEFSDSDVLVIDSTDSEDLDELEAKLQNVYFGRKPRAVASCSHPDANNSVLSGHSRPILAVKPQESQDDVLVLSSSEEDTVDAQLWVRHQASNSNNTTKGSTTNGTSTVISKVQEGDQIREQAKLQRDINKLVTDKKSTLKEFTVELSRNFKSHTFANYLEAKLAAHGGSISFFDSPPQIEFLIRFKRQHVARYDNRLKEWIPVAPYTALEDLYVLLLPADTLALAIFEETLSETLSVLRNTHNLTTRSQIFIMVDGLNVYYKRKGGPRDKRNRIESALASLQALERCFIVQVEGAEDSAQWLFNITGDLGIRPHKRIRESFLPFCTDTQVKCGTSKADTYKKMLQQIRNITESAAEGIIKEAPALRILFEGYACESEPHNRYDRLKQVTVSRRKDGAAKSRILNQALSKRVHDVIWGEDPLTLV